MIRKLRVKLVFASMASLFIVLLVIMGSITVLNYSKVVADADSTLAILAENDGAFPEMPPKNHRPFSPELPYESRYFFVTLDEQGGVITVNTGRIAAVDTSEAIEYAQKAFERGHEKGFLGNFRYVVSPSETETRVIFLDCGRSLGTFRTFLLTSAAVSAGGILAVFLLMVFLSGRIVKPFLENYEKQKRFITDAGHELKTPLTIIDADAEVLEMDLGENEWISDIKNQTKRLADLTGSLILLSRMEEEQTRVQMIDFPLSDIAEEVLSAFQALAKTQNKTLEGNIAPMLTMHGDERAIRQLIGILLDNAVKYSRAEGTIYLTLEKQKNAIRLCVRNTTEHISKEHIGRLFDRFYRADQSRNSQTGGYGLGLSIAAAIVGAHKGKISASSEDECSLTVTAVFPIA